MKKDKNLSIFTYMELGAEARLFKTLITKMDEDYSKVLNYWDVTIFKKIISETDRIFTIAKDRMRMDYPELNADTTFRAFYGATNNEPVAGIDAYINKFARDICNDLVYDESQQRS